MEIRIFGNKRAAEDSYVCEKYYQHAKYTLVKILASLLQKKIVIKQCMTMTNEGWRHASIYLK